MFSSPTMLPRFSFLYINLEKGQNCVEGHVHITHSLVLRMLSSITGIERPNSLVGKKLPSILEGKTFWNSIWCPGLHNGNLYMLCDFVLDCLEPTCAKTKLTSYILEGL